MNSLQSIVSETIRNHINPTVYSEILDYRKWLSRNLPNYDYETLSQAHIDAWEWSDLIRLNEFHDHLILCLGRNMGKSTLGESLIVKLGAELRRKYVWVVSETQPQADKTVRNISNLIGDSRLKFNYPEFATRKLTEYGHSQGWTRQLLLCNNGFIVEGIGLNKAVRSTKIDLSRPDFIFFNDCDNKDDTREQTDKKETLITDNILAAGESNVVVLFAQNLIADDSICDRLMRDNKPAQYLSNRIRIGPIPLVDNLGLEEISNENGVVIGRKIVKGTPNWPRYTMQDLQHILNTQGYDSFIRESQQKIKRTRTKGLVKPSKIRRVHKLPETFAWVIVIVDPSGGGNDDCGIIVLAIDKTFSSVNDPTLFYVLDDMSTDSDPEIWSEQVAVAYNKYKANYVIAESNYGGKMVSLTINTIDKSIPVKVVNASKAKEVRAEPTAQLYNDGRIFHLGNFPYLVEELTSQWSGSPNRLDSLAHGVNWLVSEKIYQGDAVTIG